MPSNSKIEEISLDKVKFEDIIKHKVNLSTKSSSSDLVFKGHFSFADSTSKVLLPFIKLSWNDTVFTFSPFFRKKSSASELARLRLLEGGCNVYLAPKNPILLLHDGFLDFNVEMHSDSKSDQFLSSWKLFVRNLMVPNAPNFVPFVFGGRNAKASASFTVPAVLPSLSFLRPFVGKFYRKAMKSFDSKIIPENWANWFNSLAETTVKIAGLRGLTTQLLIELPQMEICSKPQKFDSFSVDFRIEMTSIDLNICRRNKKTGNI